MPRRPALLSVLLGAGLVPLVALASTGCDPKESGPEPKTAPERPAASATPGSAIPTSARPGDPTPDPITHPCAVAGAQFDEALKAADAACKTDAECDCYPGGVTANAGCGGVTGATTAKELHRIAAQFRADGCDWVQDCAARACEPKCVDGTCQ